jgi:hypothetical protein
MNYLFTIFFARAHNNFLPSIVKRKALPFYRHISDNKTTFVATENASKLQLKPSFS